MSSMEKRKSSLVTVLLCVLFGFGENSGSGQVGQGKKAATLEIICPNGQKVSYQELKLSVFYVNHSHEPIVLPLIYMSSVNIQEFVFPNRDIMGGISSDYAVPPENVDPCKPEDLIDSQHLRYILPNDTLKVEYDLNKLGYENVEGGYISGKKYEFYIELVVPKELKNICSNLWIGHVRSGNGSFIIE